MRFALFVAVLFFLGLSIAHAQNKVVVPVNATATTLTPQQNNAVKAAFEAAFKQAVRLTGQRSIIDREANLQLIEVPSEGIVICNYANKHWIYERKLKQISLITSDSDTSRPMNAREVADFVQFINRFTKRAAKRNTMGILLPPPSVSDDCMVPPDYDTPPCSVHDHRSYVPVVQPPTLVPQIYNINGINRHVPDNSNNVNGSTATATATILIPKTRWERYRREHAPLRVIKVELLQRNEDSGSSATATCTPTPDR